MCTMSVGAFFGPQVHRKDFAIGVVAILLSAFFVLAAMTMPGLACIAIIVVLFLVMVWAAANTDMSTATDPVIFDPNESAGFPQPNPTSTSGNIPRLELELELERQERRRWSIATRRSLWEKHNKQCYYCSQSLVSWRGEHMHLDHVFPLSKGGVDTEANLRPTCPVCNLEKSSKHFPELFDNDDNLS